MRNIYIIYTKYGHVQMWLSTSNYCANGVLPLQEFLKKMFNRYWRDYPWFMQVMLFGLMVFTFAFFFLFAANMLIPRITGYSINALFSVNETSSPALIQSSLTLQLISAIGVFALPAISFAHLTHPRKWEYLGLRKPVKLSHLVLSVLIILAALPIFLELASLIKLIDFGKGANEMQGREEQIQKAYLNIKTPAQFAFTFLVMAIVPAVVEELFFRGVVFRLVYKQNGKLLLSAIVSAIVFALMHGSPYNYLSIFLAGLMLCYIYYLTGSLWCNIAAHLFYNGIQVYLIYLSDSNQAIKAIIESNKVPMYYFLGGVIVFAVCLYLLFKSRTPLGKYWANDYTQEEMEQIANSENNNEQ